MGLIYHPLTFQVTLLVWTLCNIWVVWCGCRKTTTWRMFLPALASWLLTLAFAFYLTFKDAD